MLSPASLSSDHCRQQLELAAALNKLVIPVYHEVRALATARLPRVVRPGG